MKRQKKVRGRNKLEDNEGQAQSDRKNGHVFSVVRKIFNFSSEFLSESGTNKADLLLKHNPHFVLL